MSARAARHPGEFRWETRLLAVITLMLTALGIASCYASGAYYAHWFHQATQQAYAALAGGVLFLLAARMDYRLWRKVALPLFLATIIGLVLIAFIAMAFNGRHAPGALDRFFPYINGAHRWIALGAQVQVSEIARFTLAVWLATFAADLGMKVRDLNDGFLQMIGVVAIVCALVVIEPSLSMSITLGVIGLTVIFTAGARVPHMAVAVGISVVVVALALKLNTMRKHRADEFRGPALECSVTTQPCQGLVGFGLGGIKGVGFGNGTSKLGQTAEVDSDYLLSVIGEEWGFIGVVFVALLYAIFCAMGFRIARTAPDPFGTYLAAGLTVAVGATAFMHAAVNTGLMPSTGLTLPFMSVGRVSLVLYLLSAGVLVSIGRQRGRPPRAA